MPEQMTSSTRRCPQWLRDLPALAMRQSIALGCVAVWGGLGALTFAL